MPKRKNSSPIKFRKSLESFSFVGNDSSSASSSKRVSFDLQDTDSFQSTPEHSSKSCKRKKILKEVPPNATVLGELSFIVQAYEDSNYDFNDLRLCLLANGSKEKLDLAVEVFSYSKSGKTFFNIEALSDFPWIAINDLLSRYYLWIVSNVDGLGKGVINVNIAILCDNTPIPKAKNVMELFTQKTYPDYSSNSINNIDCMNDFFKELQIYQRNHLKLPEKNVQHVFLKPTLCPYQGRAVQWMLHRESGELHAQNSEWLLTVIENFPSKSGRTVYYNKYSQEIFLELFGFPPFPRGGILADEMGLGKTVAVIALVLNNSRNIINESDNDDYLLPMLSESEPKVKLINSGVIKEDDPESDIRILNKETHLNSHEKLLICKENRGPAVRKALSEWYESQLSVYSAATPNKKRRVSTYSIKCICGNATSKGKEKCVQCPECERFQHISCVGYQEGYRYFCPPCWTKQELLKSNATLIISPTSIYHQWFEEIKKHVSPDAFPNGIFMYDSVKNNFVQPSVLASHDIVISTYVRMRGELNHAIANESSRKLRNEERFLKQCSPLTQIQWWRLCLDEAQMVANECSHINQMAKLITAVNRWSVTGTPIQNYINDIFHLIDCMRIEPFTDKVLWNNLLYLPYINGNKTPLCSTVSQIFWRNSKEDVSDELSIPEQKVKYHFLKFTAVEQNFYRREHATSSHEFAEGLRRSGLKVTRTIDSVDKHTLTRLLHPLLNLRQACSHPLAVKGNKISTKNRSMTLTELFKYLYSKTKIECEEELRKHISALNGLAGIYCIMEDWNNAVEHYRKVLRIAEEYNDKVNVDSLQRIHTLTNLAEVLQVHGKGIPPTLRDDSLKDQAKALEDKYMKKAIGDVISDRKLLEDMALKITDLESKFMTGSDVWWVRIIHSLTIDKAIEEVMDKISNELLANQTENKKHVEVFLSKISSPKGVELMLRNWLQNLAENREKARKQLKILSLTPCEELVFEAVNCHLRTNTSSLKRKKCRLCVCEHALLDYECNLFAVSMKVLKEEYEKVLDGAQTKGSWKAHNGERLLRAILSVGKSKASTEKWPLKDGRNHINMLESMKKEFKQLRVLWMSLNHQVQAHDEVSMCKMRLRLRFPGEPIPPKPTKLNLKQQNKVETINIIEHHEVDAQKLKLTSEIELYRSEFKKKYGTLLYLDNLGKKENASPEPCPVCKTPLENEWCVLQCGHSYCIDCVRILLMRNFDPSINCPVCREVTKSGDLSFVDQTGREENCEIKVVGEHSTKVEAIVRTLLELRMKDEDVKVLIFSTWAVVLNVLVVALQENGIKFRRMPGNNYQAHLKEFKDPRMKVTALLLPISWGSKGLNLIEATHVFLVEPIMNPAEELQALGRVHRIGQTKETYVHRFLISGTIEEKIHSAVSESKVKWNWKKVTLEDLKTLFDIKNDLIQSN